jgi:superfamily I DNA and/or RNA helicase
VKIPNLEARSSNRERDGHMTSAPIRDPLADHLITPQNAALLLIDYQPAQSGHHHAGRNSRRSGRQPCRYRRLLTARPHIRRHDRSLASGTRVRAEIARQRIQGSPEAQAWRLAHLAEYRASRTWMIRAADRRAVLPRS